MKIISDIHTEFLDGDQIFDQITPDKNEILIVAGDIGKVKTSRLKNTLQWFNDNFKHTIMVLGNHDYWGLDIMTAIKRWRDRVAKYPNITLLQNDQVTIDGQHFIGTTLWTDFHKQNPLVAGSCFFAMNDFNCINRFNTTAG